MLLLKKNKVIFHVFYDTSPLYNNNSSLALTANSSQMTHYYCTLVRYHIPTSLCKAIISRNVFIFIKIPPKSACNQGNFIVLVYHAPCNFPFSSPATILRFKSQLRETFLENFFTYTTQYAKAALFKVTSSFQREVKKCVSTPICMDVIFKE